MQTIPTNILKLPHLPVPSLHQTSQKYLKSILPFVNTTELRKSEKLIEKFTSEDGTKLHELLIKKAQNADNWLSDWIQARSLEFRKSIHFLSSLILLPIESFNSDSKWMKHTAQMIIAAVHCHLDIIDSKFPKESLGNTSLCVNQYKGNFGTTRIPRRGKDVLQYHEDSKHIIIIRRNNFFKLNVLNIENRVVTEEQLLNTLEDILQQSEVFAEPIGMLPSDERESWAEARAELLQHSVNRQSLKEIESSLFSVSLDESIPLENDILNLSIAGKYLLHGGGSKINSANRWCDKTIQFIITRNGAIGILFEHTNIDAQAAARIVDHIQNYIHHTTSTDATITSTVDVNSKKIKFLINDSLEKYITNSEIYLNRFVQSHQLEVFEIEPRGNKIIESPKLSSGNFIQAALQLAYYRMYEIPIPIHEPTHTRIYFLGRLDYVRSCSVEMMAFTKVMLDTEKSHDEKFEALVNAVNTHEKLKHEAQEGYGCDQHFLGLKNVSIENGLKLPDIFADPHFIFTSEPKLTASEITVNCNGLLCSIPQRDDYFTCSYNQRPHCISFSLMGNSSCTEHSLKHFAELLKQSFKDIHNLLIEVKN